MSQTETSSNRKWILFKSRFFWFRVHVQLITSSICRRSEGNKITWEEKLLSASSSHLHLLSSAPVPTHLSPPSASSSSWKKAPKKKKAASFPKPAKRFKVLQVCLHLLLLPSSGGEKRRLLRLEEAQRRAERLDAPRGCRRGGRGASGGSDRLLFLLLLPLLPLLLLPAGGAEAPFSGAPPTISAGASVSRRERLRSAAPLLVLSSE